MNNNDKAFVMAQIADLYKQVPISTTDATPAEVFRYSLTASEKCRVEVLCNALKDTTGGYGAVKSRSFFWNGTTVEAGVLNSVEPDEYFGTGLSTCSFDIRIDGSDIVVEFTGEASTAIQAEIKIKLTRLVNTNLL